MTTVAKRLMTVDDFFRLNPESRCELVRGEIVAMSPKKWLHGRLTDWIDKLLTPYLEQKPIGRLAIEAGFLTGQNPDTLRIPDLVYVSYARWSREAEEAVIDAEEVLPLAPDLAIEIRSPDDRWSAVEAKIDEYLRAGVHLVWVIDPRRRSVHVYRSDGSVTRLTLSDTLTGEDVLPGFEVSVADLLARKRSA
jgi:Uma2 family endonuclease